MKECLEFLANVSAILTAAIAVAAWGFYQCGLCKKKKTLESYLKQEKVKSKDKGQRSILHLMAKLGLTESEVLQASFKSRHIKRQLTTDEETGLANSILLEYVGNSNSDTAI